MVLLILPNKFEEEWTVLKANGNFISRKGGRTPQISISSQLSSKNAEFLFCTSFENYLAIMFSHNFGLVLKCLSTESTNKKIHIRVKHRQPQAENAIPLLECNFAFSLNLHSPVSR